MQNNKKFLPVQKLIIFGHHHMITNMQRIIIFRITTTHAEIHLIPILIILEVTYSVHQRLNPSIEDYNLQIRCIDAALHVLSMLIRMDWLKKYVVQCFHLR
jgi:hypothetical protein